MVSWLLVLAQFVLAAVIVLSARWDPPPWGMLLLAMPGIVIAIWAWFRMGLRKIRVHPEATATTELIVSGPYAIVRHPMYSGLLWFTAALLIDPAALWRMVLWMMLSAVLYAKTLREEEAMRKRFPEYDAYCERVGRLLPAWRRRRF